VAKIIIIGNVFFEDVGEFKVRSQRDPPKAVRFFGLV